MRARPPLRLAFLAAFGFAQPAHAADYSGPIGGSLVLMDGDRITGDLTLAGDLTIPPGITVLVTEQEPGLTIQATNISLQGTLDATAVSNESSGSGADAQAPACQTTEASGGGGGNGGAGGPGQGGAAGGPSSLFLLAGSPGGRGATCGTGGQAGGLGGGRVEFITDTFTFGTDGVFLAPGGDGAHGGPVGAGGGGSGGALSISTVHLVINRTATIDVRGGDGGSLSNSLGGGGGGGGQVLIQYQTIVGAAPHPQVGGGTGLADGFPGTSSILQDCLPDLDNDSYNTCADCNDLDASVHPDATEICNGVDDDCDGVVDNGPPSGDLDDDGLTAHEENLLGTSDCVADTDGDGVLDGAEQHGDTDNDGTTDIFDDDDDGDGLATLLEHQLGSNPLAIDTDGDGRPDCEEAGIPCDRSIVVHALPNPPLSAGRGVYQLLDPDDDGDGIPSAWEFFTRHDTTGAVTSDGTCDTMGHPYPQPRWHETTAQYHYICPDGHELFPTGTDLDLDGLPNHLDDDDDGDGLPTDLELTHWLPIPWERDGDGDGILSPS